MVMMSARIRAAQVPVEEPSTASRAEEKRIAPATGTRFGAAAVENRHLLVAATDVTSSVIKLKPASMHGPNEVTMATSVASRPRAIRMRPILGLLCRASNVYQQPPR